MTPLVNILVLILVPLVGNDLFIDTAIISDLVILEDNVVNSVHFGGLLS